VIDVVVIGGGVSGLTTAWRLREKGVNVMVLERQRAPGGNAISENIHGFLMEHGPSTINAAVPEVGEMSNVLGMASSVVDLSGGVKNRYLVKNGQLKGIPVHPLGFMTSRYLSVTGRVRMLFENFIKDNPDKNDETVEDYFSRRFGQEFANRIMDPLVGGLYAGRSDQLSMRSVFPKVLELEKKYGSLSKGMWARYRDNGRMPSKKLYSWQDGIGALPKMLSRVLLDHIKTGVVVKKIRSHGSGYVIETAKHGTLAARAVVVATQPHVAAGMLENVAPDAASAIGGISAPPLAVVFMGFKRANVDHSLNGLGYLSPSSENSPFTGVQFPSSMFAGRAPKGHVALAAYMGGARFPDIRQMDEQDVGALAAQEFKDRLGTRGPATVAKVRFWPTGIPQYNLGHQNRVEIVQAMGDENPGLFVTGNYLGGPSVGSCVGGAFETASWVGEFLQQHRVLQATAI